MNRAEVLDSVRANVESENMVRHMLAAEAVMRALARHLNENEGEWGLTGLLHDIDAELTEGDMASHSRLGADLARELGASQEVAHAILAHNKRHGVPLDTKLDKALFCCDPLTNLIAASAQVQPDKTLAGLEASSLAERFGEKGFAPGADRERIAQCSHLGVELEEFFRMGLEAMQRIAPTLGL
jgi:putative nucleotidyltransferase with HDIG domain